MQIKTEFRWRAESVIAETDMFGFKKKKKKKKVKPEQFVSLKANGEAIKAYNFALLHDDDGTPRLEVRTPDVCEALHYDEIDFEMKTSNKCINVRGKFREAQSEKKFKIYVFDVEDFNQFYI